MGVSGTLLELILRESNAGPVEEFIQTSESLCIEMCASFEELCSTKLLQSHQMKSTNDLFLFVTC